MAKALVITGLLVVVIGLLIYIAAREPPVITQPVPQPEDRGQQTPRAPPLDIGTPTPKAPEITPTAPGAPAELVFPTEVNFWINDIRAPDTTSYQEGLNYIPIKKTQIKTFAGSVGPYYDDPTEFIRIMLCAEFYKVTAAPACEIVKSVYKNNYITFAKGYQYDEYIGGMAAKDYIAYFDVFVGDTKVAGSNKAVIRTVSD